MSSHPAARLLATAGPTVSMAEAARVLGCSKGTAYVLHDRGELAAIGVRVLRLGRSLRVSTASLRRALEADEPEGAA